MIFPDNALSGSLAMTKLRTEKLVFAPLRMRLTGRALDWPLQVLVRDWPARMARLPSILRREGTAPAWIGWVS